MTSISQWKQIPYLHPSDLNTRFRTCIHGMKTMCIYTGKQYVNKYIMYMYVFMDAKSRCSKKYLWLWLNYIHLDWQEFVFLVFISPNWYMYVHDLFHIVSSLTMSSRHSTRSHARLARIDYRQLCGLCFVSQKLSLDIGMVPLSC